MFNQDFTEFTSWFKGNTPMLEILKKLQEINTEAYEHAVRELISYNTDSMATLMKGLQTLPRITNPETFAAEQMKLATEQGQKFMTCVQNLSKICQSTFKDQQSWMADSIPNMMKAQTAEKRTRS